MAEKLLQFWGRVSALNLLEMLVVGLERLSNGGLILFLIILCSIWTHTIILERIFRLQRKNVIHHRSMTSFILEELVSGDAEVAIDLCRKNRSQLNELYAVLIENRQSDAENLKRTMRVSIHESNRYLRRYLDMLGMLASVAMYMGLLGTVLGMVSSFGSLYSNGGEVGDLAGVADGVSSALLTTAAGLIAALPALVAHNYFTHKVDNFIVELERHGMSLVRFLVNEEAKLLR